MAAFKLSVMTAILCSGICSAAQDPPPRAEGPGDPVSGPTTVGDVAIENTSGGGSVCFAEYKKSYDVQFSIPVLAADKGIDAGRFCAWLLAKSGRAIPLREGPDKGVLPVASTNGQSGTAVAMFDFAHDVEVKDLAGIVVAVDGKLTAFAMPKVK